MAVFDFQPPAPADVATNWVDLLRWRAQHQPGRHAYLFLQDGDTPAASLTYGELDRQARGIATRMQAVGTLGARALLLYSSGLEFVSAFFGCLYAGMVAIPTPAPRSRGGQSDSRLNAIVRDCGATIALTTSALYSHKFFSDDPELGALIRLRTDDLADDEGTSWQDPGADACTLAFLQYTSGSTGTPKGVMISHGNLLHNAECLRQGFRLGPETVTVSWLPAFHDMGLGEGVTVPMYNGSFSVLMPPASFLQRPSRWLAAIARYRGTHAAAPNFAYDLCVAKTDPDFRRELDLSSWTTALNGAEPVRPETVERFCRAFGPCGFRAHFMRPGYGLAEATMMVTTGRFQADPVFLSVEAPAFEHGRIVETSSDRPGVKRLAGSGVAWNNTTLEIVNPESNRRCAPDEIGEIWVASAGVSEGYWQRPDATEATFRAYLADTGAGPFLKTGDRGYVKDGELFVTGRIKDLIIIRGRNHYPQDIEGTVEQCHAAMRLGSGAAFSVDVADEERLVVAHEVEREHLRRLNAPEVIATIRQAIAEQHDLQVHAVLLLRTASIPKTTSGKIQRSATRAGFLEGTLSVVAEWRQTLSEPTTAAGNPIASAEQPQPSVTPDVVRTRVIAQLAAALNLDAREIDPDQPFARYGLDSAAAVALAADIEDWLGRPVPQTLAYDYPTANLVARYLTKSAAPERPGARTKPHIEGEAIAIVGLSCRFPRADNPEAFWSLLRGGVDAVRPVPRDRWDVDVYYDPDLRPGTMNTRWAGLLDEVDRFDASFFGISPTEAASMDPQQRIVLEVAWEALERAGIVPSRLAGSATGVFIGATHSDYFGLLKGAPSRGGTGVALSIIANRLSYLLDLRGPSFVVDTACSSSLLAAHLARKSLLDGECDLALAGGVSLILRPDFTVSFAQAGLMAPDGRCKTFDASANGYVRGEGCGIVVLKRLLDAREQGDPILAVIRGSATNQDGRSNGLTAPNSAAQRQVIRRTLDAADLEPSQISYIEAHGTGTPLGDAVEVGALQEIFGGRRTTAPCVLGAVKTNIGHLEAAAGVAGLIKLVLSLGYGEIPPVVHFQALNPNLNGHEFPFVIPTEVRPWPADGETRRASISSFSFGGSNVHMIVEEAPPVSVARPAAGDRPLHVLTVSAKSETALTELVQRHADHLRPDAVLADVCHTANAGRTHFGHRAAVVTSAVGDLRRTLDVLRAGSETPGARRGAVPQGYRPTIAFSFTGQGSQYEGMGRQLFDAHPAFRRMLTQCDEVLRPHLEHPLLSVLYPSTAETAGLLERTDYAQPAIVALEVALARVLQAWGIEPAAVIGHSVGEFAAACVADAIRLEDVLPLVARRGRLMHEVSQPGLMAAVAASEADVANVVARYENSVAIAAVNGPRNVVVSGRRDAIEAVLTELEDAFVTSRTLRGDYAFHSPLVEGMLDEFQESASRVEYRPTRIPMVSNIDGSVRPAGTLLDGSHWRRHARVPVRFEAGITNLAASGCDTFLEVGPGDVLTQLGSRCVPKGTSLWRSCLRRGHDEWRTVLETVADVYVAGVDVNWREFDREYIRRTVALPTYPFQRKRFWLGSADIREGSQQS